MFARALPPSDATQTDVDVLLDFALIEYGKGTLKKESFSGNRSRNPTSAPLQVTNWGYAWLAWYNNQPKSYSGSSLSQEVRGGGRTL